MKKPMLNFSGNLSRRVAFFALFLAISLTGCESLSGGCGFDDSTTDILPCTTPVTVVSAGCATGAFQNRWLQLDNGELLQPFENQTTVASIEPGQRFLIGYEVMKRDKRYDGQVVCLALPPNGTPVKLLCMTPTETTGETCNTFVTARTVECSFGAWGNTWLQLDNGQYLQPWHNGTTTQQLVAGARYKIGYKPMAKDNRFNNGVVCAAMPSDPKAWNPEVVSVNCLEEVTGN